MTLSTTNLDSCAKESSESVKEPDILQFLFDDVARLPIITTPHQELWLGIQLRAAERLAVIVADWRSLSNTLSLPLFLCQTLLESWALLEKQCQTPGFPSPRPEICASESLSARRNVYALQRSRILRFIRRVHAEPDKNTRQELLNLAYQAVETLSILSSEALVRFVEYANVQQDLPTADDIASWLPEDLETIEQQVKHLTTQVEQTLTTGYLRYAMRVAQSYLGQGLDYADLVQAGFIGLLRAASKFDYRVQGRFGTYATSWIWQAIGREIADHGSTIRLPVHVQEDLRKLEAACNQFDDGHHDPVSNPVVLFHAGLLEQSDYDLLQEVNRRQESPSAKTIAQYEEAVTKARSLQSYSAHFLSLEDALITTKAGELLGETESLAELLLDENSSPDTELDLLFARQAIAEQAFSFLTEREREVVELRFGWTDGEARTLEEVGDHFGLTRERIRQIEARAFKKLNRRMASGLLSDMRKLLPDDKSPLAWKVNPQIVLPNLEGNSDKDNSEWGKLDALLSQLPRSHWREKQPGDREGQRREQLVAALQLLAVPAHVTDIAEQLNGMVADQELDDAHIYNLLIRDEEAFILLGQGVFSLVAWEQTRAKEPHLVLTCCPMPLPDPPDYEDAFFESVLVGQQALAQGLTAGQFVRFMLDWAKVEPDQQRWYMQAILSAYYLVDLIPYVFYFGGESPVLSCMLPPGNIQDLRYHCLEALTGRLVAMPEFWWLLQQRQPARPADLGERFADIHPYGLDDVLQRLRLLASLGAAQKLKYGAYRLTSLGEECATRWKKEVLVKIEVQNFDFEDSFGNFTAW